MTSTASAIGNKFVLKYYTILSEKPESLWHFFKNFSEFTYGSEEDILPDDTVVGAENISHKIESSDFKDCKVSLSVVDCHDSINGSVVVVVIGWLSNKGEAPRKFVQTFLLAVQEPAGYYVHNSVFRYLKETSPVLPNPNQAQPLHQLQPPKPTETKQEKEPEVAVEKPAPTLAVEPVKQEEPKQSPPVEEVKKEEIPPVKQEPPVPVVVEKEQEKPAEPPKKPENKEEKQVHPQSNRRDKKEKEKGKEKEKETQKPAAKAEEKNASQPVGWAAIVTKTVSISKSEPQQPPVQAPKLKAKETKEQTPKEAPKEAPKEVPKEAPKEANNHSETKSDKPEKKPSKNASSTSGFLPLEENLTVFVSNIPFQATEEQVRECFSKAGEVRSVVVRAKQGYCFVEFSTAEVVQKALQLAKGTQFLLDGRVLSLEEKKPNWEGGWKKEPKKDFKKKPQGLKSNGNGKPKENIEKDNKPKKPFLKEGIVSQ